jgi:hypothetical protein
MLHLNRGTVGMKGENNTMNSGPFAAMIRMYTDNKTVAVFISSHEIISHKSHFVFCSNCTEVRIIFLLFFEGGGEGWVARGPTPACFMHDSEMGIRNVYRAH